LLKQIIFDTFDKTKPTNSMTDVQLAQCKTCLNRKKGTFEAVDICNIRGFKPKDDESCPYFEQDKQVIPATENKQDYLKPNENRVKYVLIAISIVLFLDLVSAVSGYFQYQLLMDLKDGIFTPEEVLENNDLREQIIGYFYIVAYIASVVFFILWFRRAYFNLAVRTGNTQHSEGWAAGSWFVPIISLYRPYHIMKELDEETSELLSTATKKEVATNTFIIGTWWTLWIVTNYVGQYLFKKILKGESLQDYIDLTLLDIVNSCLGIPLALITVYMIKNYANKETALVAEENKKPEPQAEHPI